MAEAPQATETQTEAPPPSGPLPSDPPAAPAPEAAPPSPDKSIADGGGGPDGDQPVPATWPEDWRSLYAGNSEDDLKWLGRYKDPTTVWKAHKALRARMDSGELTRAMPETDDEEALKAWRSEVGQPETHEGYFESLPEGVEVAEEDRPMVDRYFQRMHKAGAPTKETMEGLSALYEEWEAQKTEAMERDKTNRAQTEDALRATWGPEYRGNLNEMHALFDAHAPEGLREELFSARMDENGRPGLPLGDHPGFLQFMVNLAGQVNPMGVVTSSVGHSNVETVKERIAQLESEQSDTKGRAGPDAYWNNPAKQEELRRLYDAEERMTSRARQ